MSVYSKGVGCGSWRVLHNYYVLKQRATDIDPLESNCNQGSIVAPPMGFLTYLTAYSPGQRKVPTSRLGSLGLGIEAGYKMDPPLLPMETLDFCHRKSHTH